MHTPAHSTARARPPVEMKKRRKHHKTRPKHITRACGGCAACCYAPHIKPLGLDHFTHCQHETPIGCAIYSTRPQVCRDFECLWSRGMVVPGVPKKLLRPDRLGMFVGSNFPHETYGPTLACLEAFDGGMKRPLANHVISLLAKDQLVLLMTKDDQRLVGPPKLLAEAQAKAQVA